MVSTDMYVTLSQFTKFYKDYGFLPYNPAIPLLCIHPEETRIERDTCIPTFIPTLFTIARTWKPPRCHQKMNG